jgi:4-amino-4-deoxy-L-arabinose transferase-like glycosyltransferase
MEAVFRRRWSAWVVIAFAWACTELPYLGTVSLWDIDEGLNAEAAREMYESGDWVVPRFNFRLRDAKPALLYWCVAATYHLVGIDEWGARLPSSVAVLVAAWASYELGRAMFSATVGTLAAIALVSSGLVVAMGRFANPDALLLGCTALTFLVFWRGYVSVTADGPSRTAWFVPVGVTCGLATLAKGPVGLILPGLTIVLFLVWQRDLKNLWHRQLLWGACAYLLVTVPWYLLVTIETRGEFAYGFFFKNNVERFLKPDHSHRGFIFYHALFLLVGLAPWSVWILLTLGYAIRDARNRPGPDQSITARRLLLVWLGTYLVFFSLSATKLPGYGLPMYPSVALLTARWIEGWRLGEYRPPRAVMVYSLAWLPIIGLALIGAYAWLSGCFDIPWGQFRPIPELRYWSGLGLLPIVLGVSVTLLASYGRRTTAVVIGSLGNVLLVAVVFAATLPGFNSAKASRHLIEATGAHRPDRELRLASYLYFQPSLVFYAQREVQRLDDDRRAIEHLAIPTPAILFITRSDWEMLRDRLAGRVLARAWDLYRGDEIVAVGNDAAWSSLDHAALAQR